MKIKAFNITVCVTYPLIAALCISVILSEKTIAVVAVLSAAVHEAAHIFVMRKCSDENITVKAGLFNFVINDQSRATGSYSRDIAVLCAGPAVNIALWAILFVMYKITSVGSVYDAAMVNLVLGIFNLLPIETTDGGQILGIIIKKRFCSSTADRIIFFLSLIFIVPFSVVGLYVLLRSKYNYTMLAAMVYLIAAVCSKYL